MIDIQAIILEVADEWDSLEHQDIDTPAAHAVAMATEVAQRAILAEREACAKVCEEHAADIRRGHDLGIPYADMVRLRSNAEVKGDKT